MLEPSYRRQDTMLLAWICPATADLTVKKVILTLTPA